MPVYVYALMDRRPEHPNFGLPLYVGLGTPKRPYQHIRHARRGTCRNRLLAIALQEHLALGIEPAVEILAGFDTRAEADAAEREAIQRFGRLGRDVGGILCNVARGGEGPDSTLMSDPEVIARMSEASKRYWADAGRRAEQAIRSRESHAGADAREAISQRTTAAINEPATRARHLAALQRINEAFAPEARRAAAAKKSPEATAASIAALAAARVDPVAEEKRRASNSVSQKEAWANPEIRARRIAAMTGKKKTMSPEALAARRANVAKAIGPEASPARREAAKRRWADPEFRAKRSANQAAAWADPEKRANMLAGRSEAIAASWRDPAIRARRIAGQRKDEPGRAKDHDD